MLKTGGSPGARGLFVLAAVLLLPPSWLNPADRGNDRPLVFARIVQKYGLYENYLHRFVDRPLLLDRTTGFTGDAHEVFTEASYRRQREILQAYGIDGFANLIQAKSYLDLHLRAWDLSERDLSPGIRNQFELSGHLKPEEIRDFLQVILARGRRSPTIARVDGKILITTYVADAKTPAEWAGILEPVRRAYPNEFAILLDLPSRQYLDMREYNRCGGLSNSTLEAWKSKFRSYLEVGDGLLFAAHHSMDTPEGHFIPEYYALLIDTMKSVLAEYAPRGKYLGLCAGNGYVNHFTGSTTHEDGTRVLRRQMELALAAKPSVIILPEWNEANEGNSIQPTMCNSFSTMRILRFYAQTMRGENPSPLPTDRLDIPNLVLSFPQTVELGERMDFEVLNIPDSSASGALKVEIHLEDLAGREIRKTSSATLELSRLEAATFSVPSEECSEFQSIRPSLHVVDAKGASRRFAAGFPGIRLVPNNKHHFKWVKLPLRDLLMPLTVSFGWADPSWRPGQEAILKFAFRFPEELASLELLENGVERWAQDPLHEFPDRESHAIFYGSWAGMDPATNVHMVFEIPGADFQFRPIYRADNVIAPSTWKRDGSRVILHARVNSVLREFYLVVPKAALASGVLNVESSGTRRSIPLGDLHRQGGFGWSMARGIFLRFERFDDLPNLPFPIHDSNVSGEIRLRPESASSLYEWRAISKSGKIFRSACLGLGSPVAEKPASTALPVWSETQGRPLLVQVDKAALKDFEYEFNGRGGDLLRTPASPEASGEIGGGATYAWPFSTSRSYPKEGERTAARWIEEAGTNGLSFDGRGNYVAFNRIFPTKAFTLAFEFKPMADKEQILFRNHNPYLPYLEIRIKNREIVLGSEDYYNVSTVIPTKLFVNIGDWSRLEVSYDLKALTVRVDGRAGRSFPFPYHPTRRLFQFGGCEFGGWGPQAAFYFEGSLKSFRVRDWPTPLP
ncbi:MAG: hypothetical protein J0L75_07750 [Spirochaetes bacterium]|nr:hypothetical protein [Spirochaetota bacterium]